MPKQDRVISILFGDPKRSKRKKRMTPTPKSEELRIEKTVFDLDSKADVDLVKVVPDWQGISTVAEFNTRLGADHTKILAVLNKGLREYEAEQLATNSEIPWKVQNEEGELADFSGTPISEEKSKQLDQSVLVIARMSFGYAKEMIPGDVDKNREAKKEAKKKALEFLLSAPAAIESLKG